MKNQYILVSLILPLHYVVVPNSAALYLECVQFRLNRARKCIVSGSDVRNWCQGSGVSMWCQGLVL